MNQLVSMRIEQNLDSRYTKLAVVTGRSKSFYMKQALEDYIEDLEDVYIAIKRLETPTGSCYTFEETQKMVNELEN